MLIAISMSFLMMRKKMMIVMIMVMIVIMMMTSQNTSQVLNWAKAEDLTIVVVH